MRLDCGVCGLPAAVKVEVTHDGYMVPRCFDHAEDRPYQAEARLHERSNALGEIYDVTVNEPDAAEAATKASHIAQSALGGVRVSGRAELEAAIRLHRETVEAAGRVQVSDDASRAAAGLKHEADRRLWAAVDGETTTTKGSDDGE